MREKSRFLMRPKSFLLLLVVVVVVAAAAVVPLLPVRFCVQELWQDT
jgi:hypothetical protein